MSRAIQCDRCGKYQAVKQVRSSVLSEKGKQWRVIEYNPSTDEHTEICPECSEEFDAFMSGKK